MAEYPILGELSPTAACLDVVVLGGGNSNERNVSLSSAAAMIAACERLGHHVTYIDPLYGHDLSPRQPDLVPFIVPSADESLSDFRFPEESAPTQPASFDVRFIDRLVESHPDVVLNALHGGAGEDGTIQGVLECLNLRYSHSGVGASAAAMNKQISRALFDDHGVHVPNGFVCDPAHAAREHIMEPPYIVKPVGGGSSVAVAIVKAGDPPPAEVVLGSHWPEDEDALIEEYIGGRELTCAVIGDKVLGVIEILTDRMFYDYVAKYVPGGSTHIDVTELLHPSAVAEIRSATLRAHQALGCRGVTRTDFRFDDNDTGYAVPIALELNPQPGMTETSLVPDLVRIEGFEFDHLVQWMIEDALCHFLPR